MNARTLILVSAMLVAACGGQQVSDRYRAERQLFDVESKYLALKRLDQSPDLTTLRGFAADFESAAMHIATWSASHSQDTRAVEARAWLRAVECHFALLDSGRAELIIATLAANHGDLPEIVGPVAYQLGQTAETEGKYRTALTQYRVVVENVVPDPGPEPDEVFDPEAPSEEETINDLVLGLPLRSTRLAALDTSFVELGALYEEASIYYRGFSDDRSAFVRVEATRLLAAVEADQGHWREASLILDRLESAIPRHVIPRRQPWTIRLESFVYQVKARDWGECSDDSLRTLLARLVDDYPRGDAGPSAVLEVARSEAARGEFELALADLHRLRRDWPTSSVLPDAQLLRARLYAITGNWDESKTTLREIPLEFPTSGAALLAPLEIAAHYRDAGDRTGELEALLRAEGHYREVLERYPEGDHSVVTHERLVQTLTLLGQHQAAVDELLAMCDGVAPLATRPALLVEAARRTEVQLGQPADAAGILERVAEEFPNTQIGRQAVRSANRLRSDH